MNIFLGIVFFLFTVLIVLPLAAVVVIAIDLGILFFWGYVFSGLRWVFRK